MASKLWVHEPDTFFLEAAREISEKRNFFVNRSIPKNFQQEKFSGQVLTESLRTQDSEKLTVRWGEGGVNAYGQPDRKISAFLTTSLKQFGNLACVKHLTNSITGKLLYCHQNRVR